MKPNTGLEINLKCNLKFLITEINRSTIRISFGKDNTTEDVSYLAKSILELLNE